MIFGLICLNIELFFSQIMISNMIYGYIFYSIQRSHFTYDMVSQPDMACKAITEELSFYWIQQIHL